MWFQRECSLVSRMVWDYTAARLDERDSDRVRRHLDSCQKCADEFAACQTSLRSLEAVVDHTLPQSRRGWNEIRGRIHAEAPAGPVVSPTRVRWQSALSMSGALAAGALCTLIVVGPMMRHNDSLGQVGIGSRSIGSGEPNVVSSKTGSSQRDNSNDGHQQQVLTANSSVRTASVTNDPEESASTPEPRIKLTDWLVKKQSDVQIVPVSKSGGDAENVDGGLGAGLPGGERKRNYVIGRISNLSDTPGRNATNGHDVEPQAW